MVDPSLIRPALEAARKALRELDDDHVPAPLRRVVAWSGPRLPPPLERALVAQLDQLEWLRAKALERVDDDPVSRAFLERDVGWQDMMERSSAEQLETAERRLVEALESDIARLTARVASLSEQLTAARSEVEELRRHDRLDPERTRLGEANRELRLRLEAAEKAKLEEQDIRSRLDRLLAEADSRIAELKRRLAAARADRPVGGRAAGLVFGTGDPMALARTLDDLVRAMSRPGGEVAVDPPSEAVRLPVGMAPDAAAAIEWVLSVPEALTVLIDGYNVGHELSPQPDSAVRMRLQQVAARMRRLAEGPMSVVVFWDSEVDSNAWRSDGVDMRFVPSADQAIVEAAGTGTVVISSDREVREAAGERGAIGLWSQALLAWMR